MFEYIRILTETQNRNIDVNQAFGSLEVLKKKIDNLVETVVSKKKDGDSFGIV